MSAKTNSSSSATVFPILFAVSIGHLLNDLIQATLQPMFPLLKAENGLTFAEIGLITFAFQITSSLLQPVVGTITDRYPQPFSFSFGMFFSISGIILLAFAGNFAMILTAASLIGLGSSIFHPEASRVAYSASGGRRSLAQSIFQLGGNGGTALGPLLIAFIVVPFGQKNVIWFVVAGILGFAILFLVGKWYKRYLEEHAKNKGKAKEITHNIPKLRVRISIAILLVLIFSKYFYMASITNYFIFYLETKFSLPEHQSQLLLFVFLFTITLGTLFGGILGDKYGRRLIIWISILGAAPFTLALPYMNLTGTIICLGLAGLILASAFSSILVYAQELLPGNIGMVSGLFYGFAFGMGGVGAALLGNLIDKHGIIAIYNVCSYLPLLGLAAAFLPVIKPPKRV